MTRRKNSHQAPRRRLALNWISTESYRLPIRGGARLERRAHACSDRWPWDLLRRFALFAGFSPVAVLLLAGCSSPAVRQQRLVSKPNMLFSDSAAFTYNSARLLPQLEPGSAASGGAQNAGCTACR